MVGTASTLKSARRLIAGEPGFVDAPDAAAFAAVVDLGGEDLGEEPQVGLAFPHRDLGEPGGLGADGGQVQLAGGGADRGLGGVVGARRRRWLASGAAWLVMGWRGSVSSWS